MEAEKAAFMGKITAGVTHEIKNVLAIIKESAGLLEDLISLSKDNLPPRDKFLRVLTRVNEQVTRGVDLSTSLNAFAHTGDEPRASIDLNQAVLQTALLGQRFARLKRMTLNTFPQQKTLVVTTDPLALQMLLFQCVDLVMNLLGEGSVITLEPTDRDGLHVRISGAGDPSGSSGRAEPVAAADSEAWESVQMVARRLKMSVERGGPLPWISVGFACGGR
jgi:signal transduction histidine kinase